MRQRTRLRALRIVHCLRSVVQPRVHGRRHDNGRSEPWRRRLAFADATYRKVSWRLMPFVLLCYVVAYLDRVNVSWDRNVCGCLERRPTD